MPLFSPIIDVKHRTYCGPTAIAALTGVPISRIEKMIRRRSRGYRDSTGRKLAVKGTYTSEVRRVLKTLGCRVKPFKTSEPTVAAFCEDTRHIDAAFLVHVTHHYVVTYRGMICDTFTDRQIIPAADYRKPLWRVQDAWRVDAPASPLYTVDDPIERPKAEKPPRDLQAERHARLLAQMTGWQSKLRRAQTAIRKLRPRIRYYERQMAARLQSPHQQQDQHND